MTSPIPKFLEPRLRLFLSADIVGSTAFKQSLLGPRTKPEQRIRWASKIQGFYFEAIKAFSLACEDRCVALEAKQMLGDPPKLWKTIGDEVLFSKVISDHRQVALTLDCWLEAIKSMRHYLKKDAAGLDVKSTAWVAGFPFRNSEVAVSPFIDVLDREDGDWFVEGGKILDKYYTDEKAPANVVIDYIGPSIDIGFRLTTLSSTRKLIISVDVAYILSISDPGRLDESPVFDIYYDGSTSLKGVLGGVNYPVFWIDMSADDALDRLEDQLTHREPVSRDRLRQFCKGFYRHHEGYIFPPFIDGDPSEQMRERPAWYDDDLRVLAENAKLEPQSGDEPSEAASDTADSLETAQTRIAELRARLNRLSLSSYREAKDDDEATN